jgi:hypothetical protein
MSFVEIGYLSRWLNLRPCPTPGNLLVTTFMFFAPEAKSISQTNIEDIDEQIFLYPYPGLEYLLSFRSVPMKHD